MVVRLSYCLVVPSIHSKAGWQDGPTFMTWPIYWLRNALTHNQVIQLLMIWDHLRPDSVRGVVLSGCGPHRGDETSWDCLFSTAGFTVLVGRHLCDNCYHVVLLMMGRKFCFFLKDYGFLRWCHIDNLSGLSISLQRCYVLCHLTVLYTHTCNFHFTYVMCMYDFNNALSEMTK